MRAAASGATITRGAPARSRRPLRGFCGRLFRSLYRAIVDRGVSHYHCPLDHEHPQPAIDRDGRIVCMICRIWDKRVTVCEPCRPGHNC